MAHIIDLGTYGSQLKKLYDTIVSSDPDVSWAVFNYASGENQALKPTAQGNGPLDEFVQEFNDGKVQYGFARVDYDNRSKYVLVGWVGEGVPDQTKGYFNAHYATVSKYFPGYHVQITARSSDDLTPSIILQKVADASGSKYNGISKSSTVSRAPKYQVANQGASEEDWSGTPEIKTADSLNKVQSSYKPTKVDIAAIRASASNKAPAPAPQQSKIDNTTSSSYKPVGKVDIAALRAQGKGSKFADDGPPPLQSSYKPVGKVDIAAIRTQASAKSKQETTEQISASPVADDDVEEPPKPVKDRMKAFSSESTGSDEEYQPKSVKDRMNAFSGSGRLTEMPKRTVSNTVSSRFTPGASTGRGTAPAVPSYNNLGLKNQFESSEFQDHASEGGKTPAQIWAEKHGKVPKQTSTPEIVNSSVHSEEPEEHESVADVRRKFAEASVGEPVESSIREPIDSTVRSSSVDLTSRFAADSSSSTPDTDSSSSHAGFVSVPVAVVRAPDTETDAAELVGPASFRGPRGPAFPGRPTEGGTLPVHTGPGFDEGPALPGRPTDAEEEPSLPARSTEPESSIAPTSSLTAIAGYNYEKDEDNEISLYENEVITNISQVDEDWWVGTNSRGETGLFPANYVTVEGNEDAGHAASASEGVTAIAEYDYTAEEEGELTFVEKDVIMDIRHDDENWWSGTVNGSERGVFPANYVRLQK